jgi:hypothetical protein
MSHEIPQISLGRFPKETIWAMLQSNTSLLSHGYENPNLDKTTYYNWIEEVARQQDILLTHHPVRPNTPFIYGKIKLDEARKTKNPIPALDAIFEIALMAGTNFVYFRAHPLTGFLDRIDEYSDGFTLNPLCLLHYMDGPSISSRAHEYTHIFDALVVNKLKRSYLLPALYPLTALGEEIGYVVPRKERLQELEKRILQKILETV